MSWALKSFGFGVLFISFVQSKEPNLDSIFSVILGSAVRFSEIKPKTPTLRVGIVV